MQKLFSTFPEGWPGVGLVLIRLAVAFSVVVYVITGLLGPVTETLSWPIGGLEILAVTAILIGFLTPIAAVVTALGSLVIGLWWLLPAGLSDKGSIAILVAVMSIALLFLGPGAYSLDAHLFGRRRIIIPEAPRPPL